MQAKNQCTLGSRSKKFLKTSKKFRKMIDKVFHMWYDNQAVALRGIIGRSKTRRSEKLEKKSFEAGTKLSLGKRRLKIE